MKFFKTPHLTDGEFGVELGTAFETGDFTPASADGATKGGAHGSEGMDVTLAASYLQLALSCQELLSAILKDSDFLVIFTKVVHAERNEIKIK